MPRVSSIAAEDTAVESRYHKHCSAKFRVTAIIYHSPVSLADGNFRRAGLHSGLSHRHKAKIHENVLKVGPLRSLSAF